MLYFRNANREKIQGDDGNYISEISAKEKEHTFLDENGKIDNEKFIEYLNSLPPTDKEYIELMKDIEKASEAKPEFDRQKQSLQNYKKMVILPASFKNWV